MFFESILEEVNIDEPVSESTMEEIRQLSIPNFMESALSPFDLVDKGIYENAKAYNDMVSKISKIELNYLRENGEEPVWEASDHQSIFARFIAGIKHIIQVIAGAFQKLIKSIDDMITNRYKKLGAEFVKQMQSAEIRGVDLSNKTFTLIKYEPEVGIRLLHNAENVQGNINKVDAYNEDELRYLDALINLYTHIGYPCFKVSAKEGTGVDAIKKDLEGKITLFSGHSGVGKSTLINAILPGTKVKTGEISTYHNKGMHTTTFSEMFSVDGDGYIIDTPGIKGFGTFDMEEEEIGHYFPEIFKVSADCKYGNCTHRHEPGCAVREAVEKHLISESRYTSYLNMLEDKEEGKYRAAY